MRKATSESNRGGRASGLSPLGQYKDGKVEEIINSHLKGEIAPMCLEKYGEIVVSCLLDQRIKRPSMKDVMKGLELALELLEEAKKGITLDHEEEILSQISSATTDDDHHHKYMFHNGGGDASDSKASRMTIRSNGEKISVSV